LFTLAWLVAAPFVRSQDVLTWHNDVARTGQNLNETILTPANVKASSFGKLFVLTVDGKVDAQPLYASSVTVAGKGLHNLLVVATENDSVYAFDADTGAQIWTTSALQSGETASDSRSCDQVVPEIGISGTPVIDRSSGPNGAIYLTAMSKNSAGTYFQRIHALDLTTGAELFGGPVEVQAKYPGTGDDSSGGYVIFEPGQYKQRPGLLLLNSVVYTAWGSHCDIQPYTGWIIGYNESNLVQTTVLDVVPNGGEGGIWGAGAGPAVDSSGYMYVLVGNGDFDTTLTNGFPSKGDYGNAFLKITTAGGLAVNAYFEMDNEATENPDDTDLGSGGALVLPDMTDASNTVQHLAVGAGKDTNLYLVSRDKMGGYSSSANQIYQELAGALPGGIWSSPAYYNNLLYYGPVGQPILAFQFTKALLSTSPVAQTPTSFAYPGATPSVSANQNTNGIVWAAENTDPAVLHAYDATTLQELYNSNQASGGRDQFGTGNKFITPTIAQGKVYVGTTTGVGVFGLLSPGPPSIVSLSPASGSGVSATFTAVYSDPNGATDFKGVYLLANTGPSAVNGCDVYYEPLGNHLYLANNAGTWITPALTPGVAGTASNSQCTLNAASSSVSTSGNSLTLVASLTFSSSVFGPRNVYLYAVENGGQTTGSWVLKGAWTPNASAGPPTIVSLTPATGTGTAATLTAVYSDPNGFGDLSQVELLVNTTENGANACYVYYEPQTNQLYLRNNAGTEWLTPVLTPGGSGTVASSQCTLNAVSSTVSTAGNNLTLKVALTFSSTFVNSRNVYLYAAGLDGQNSGWIKEGSWTP
jgi:hypothetical protein